MNRLEHLLKLIENEPHDPFLKYGVALEHLSAGRMEEAKAWLERTLAEHPSYPPTYYQMAKLMASQGHTAEAIHLLETGIGHAQAAKDSLTLREMRSLRSELED